MGTCCSSDNHSQEVFSESFVESKLAKEDQARKKEFDAALEEEIAPSTHRSKEKEKETTEGLKSQPSQQQVPEQSDKNIIIQSGSSTGAKADPRCSNRLKSQKSMSASSRTPKSSNNIIQNSPHLPAQEIAVPIETVLNLTALNTVDVLNKFGVFAYDQEAKEEEGNFTSVVPYKFVTSGEIYQGQWKNGQRNGQGEQCWPDGAVYQGYWKEDKRNGKGRYVAPDGEMYDGDWKDEKYHGSGKQYVRNRSEYVGDFQEGLRHGQGKENFVNQSWYEGAYEKDMKEGKGTFFGPDGSEYFGSFKKDHMNGFGEMVWPDGRKYVGEWKDSKMHGNGEFRWTDGRKFVGEYQNDMKNGYGEFEWPDGRKYKGNFLNNQMHGEGTYVANTGQARKGVWDYGVRTHWL